VTLAYTPREEGKLGILVATIRDQGEGYDTADVAHLFTGGDPTVHEEERERRRIRPGGRGRYLMRAYAHSSTYNQTNKTLYLHWDVQRFANE